VALVDPGSGITVVIREAGERTAELCHRIVAAQVLPGSVTVVSERPFAAAHEKSVRIALAQRRQWSVFLDADVLLRRDALRRMVEELESCTHTFYMMNFLVLDRGFGGPAYGVHCYRTELFGKAVKFMKVAWQDQRPETRLCKEMAKRGIPTILSRTIVGLHDYEQYYRDLYRKVFVRAAKFPKRVEYMSKRLRCAYATEPESRVMMWGLVDGVLYAKENAIAPLDIEYYQEKSMAALRMLGLAERDPLNDADYHVPIVDMINSFVPDKDYLANVSWIAPQPEGPQYFGLRDVRNPGKRGLKLLEKLGKIVRQRLLKATR